MTMIRKAQDGGRQSMHIGKMTLIACAAYGLAIGIISQIASSLEIADNSILLPLNYPGIVTFLFLNGILSPYGISPGLLLPSVLAWTLMGLVPFAIAKFRTIMD